MRRSLAVALYVAIAAVGAIEANASPITVDANPHYFFYNGQTIALVGASAEYLCHVSCATSPDPVCELTGTTPLSDYFCRYESYSAYFADLHAKHLNKVRMWIGLNHSPGWQRTANPSIHSYAKPYDFEQAFTWDGNVSKWDLNAMSSTFWSRVHDVVNAARIQGIIVEITLFDAFSGDFGFSPWNPPRNKQSVPGFTPEGFPAEQYMSSFDNHTYDVDPGDQSVRHVQTDLMVPLSSIMGKAASQLNDLDNFYWEIANEPDQNGVISGSDAQYWHDFIAGQLYTYESGLPNGHHLIALNLHSKTAIDSIKNNSSTYPNLGTHVNIVNSHYVSVSNSTPDHYGAILLVRDYNNGSQGQLNRIFGFNEGRITPDVGHPSNPNPDLSTRAEAWEFMLSGGGSFDHLGYDWKNNALSINTRTYLGKLADFLQPLTLRNMSRQLSASQLPAFVNSGLSTYSTGNTYWGAMQTTDQKQFVLYIHHSTISSDGSARYIPVVTNPPTYNNTLFLQQLGSSGSFKAEWIEPSTGAVKGTAQNFSWSGTGTFMLNTSPNYSYDIALRLTRQ